MRLYCIVLISYLLFGCNDFREEVDIIPNEVGDLVLIKGFLSPEGTIIRVRVTRAVSYFEEPFIIDDQNSASERLAITDAIVTIMDEDQNAIDLEYSLDSFAYEALATEYAIIPGRKYRLMVTAQGKEFFAECVIPLETIADVEVSTEVFENNNFRGRLNLRFNDIVGETNFYIVGAKYTPLGNDISSNSIFEENRFVTDAIGDGLSIFTSGSISSLDQNLEVIAQITNTDENTYKLFRSIYVNYRDVDDENPFLEPIIPPNNIQGEGGYGVFGGFRLYEKTVQLIAN